METSGTGVSVRPCAATFDLVVATVGRVDELGRLLDVPRAADAPGLPDPARRPERRRPPRTAPRRPPGARLERLRSATGLSRARNAALGARRRGRSWRFPTTTASIRPTSSSGSHAARAPRARRPHRPGGRRRRKLLELVDERRRAPDDARTSGTARSPSRSSCEERSSNASAHSTRGSASARPSRGPRARRSTTSSAPSTRVRASSTTRRSSSRTTSELGRSRPSAAATARASATSCASTAIPNADGHPDASSARSAASSSRCATATARARFHLSTLRGRLLGLPADETTGAGTGREPWRGPLIGRRIPRRARRAQALALRAPRRPSVPGWLGTDPHAHGHGEGACVQLLEVYDDAYHECRSARSPTTRRAPKHR